MKNRFFYGVLISGLFVLFLSACGGEEKQAEGFCGDGVLDLATEECDPGIEGVTNCDTVACTLTNVVLVPPSIETDCTDGVDNDGDDLIDCDDTIDCSAATNCDVPETGPTTPVVETKETDCSDGIDNDADGLIDCDDTIDCSTATNCVGTEPAPDPGHTFSSVFISSPAKWLGADFIDYVTEALALRGYYVPDRTFNDDGSVSVSDQTLSGANALAIQSDGKIVVAGSYYEYPSQVFLMRFNANGSLDNTFNENGVLTLVVETAPEEDYRWGLSSPRAIQIDGNGKYVVAGRTDTGGSFMVRINADGTNDTTFDPDVMVSTGCGSANDLAIQLDGKIVVAGGFSGVCGDETRNDGKGFQVLRYNEDGSLDNGFGNHGMKSLWFDASTGYVLRIDDNDRIVVAGSTYKSDTTNHDFAIARLIAENGQLDEGFGGDGMVTVDIENHDDEAYGMGLQSDGKIVVAGCSAFSDTGSDNFVVRLNEDGTRDTAFGVDGKVTLVQSATQTLGIDSSDRIIIESRRGESGVFPVVRYTSTGQLDTAFDPNGLITIGTVDSDGYSYADALGIGPHGKIVVAGSSGSHLMVVRYAKESIF